MYNADYATMQFCNGSVWISMAASGALTELDPKIGTLTANNFCTSNAGGTVIVCATASIDLATQVTGNLPVANLEQRDECRQLSLLARGWNLGDDQHGSSHANIRQYLGRQRQQRSNSSGGERRLRNQQCGCADLHENG